MGIADEICEPRYKLAKEKAKETYKRCVNGSIPVVLKDVVKELGIIVKPAEISADGFSRVDDSGMFLILFKRSVSDVRRRFTIAHEIGHILLEHISIGGDSSQVSHGSQEKEANCFAGELLVPSSNLKLYFKQNKEEVTVEDVKNRYWVSKGVAFRAVDGNGLLNKLNSFLLVGFL